MEKRPAHPPEADQNLASVDATLAAKRAWLAQAQETLARAARTKNGGKLEAVNEELAEFFSRAYALAQTRIDLARVDAERECVAAVAAEHSNVRIQLSQILIDGHQSDARRAALARIKKAEPTSFDSFLSYAEPIFDTTLTRLKKAKPKTQEAEILAADTMLSELTWAAYARAETRTDVQRADALSKRVDLATQSDGLRPLIRNGFEQFEDSLERRSALRKIERTEPKDTRGFLETNAAFANEILQGMRAAVKPSQETTGARLAVGEKMLRLLLRGAYDRARSEADVDAAEAFRATIAESLGSLPAKIRALVYVDYFNRSERHGDRAVALRRIERAKTKDAP